MANYSNKATDFVKDNSSQVSFIYLFSTKAQQSSLKTLYLQSKSSLHSIFKLY